jgi:hypothetical protein
VRGLCLAAILALATPVLAAPPFPAATALPPILDRLGGADLVIFDELHPPQATRIFLATRVRAPLERLQALMRDAAAYRRAIPSFRRADVVASRPPAVQVAWELEVPLWNLEGKLWLRPVDGGVDLLLAEGDLSPGLFELRARPAGDTLVLTIEARANVREANWVARRLARRSPLSEPAMTAAAAWVLLRALVLEAEHGPRAADPRRNPTAPLAPPAVQTLDGGPLGKTAALLPALVSAAVHCRPSGRLERIEVAVPVPGPAGRIRQAILDPQRWRALPGWHRVQPVAPLPHPSWEVDSRMPFVDFDATWAVTAGPPFRAVAIGGDGRGAVLGWDLLEGRAGTVAVFSLHPRLEKAGYIPRKFIEAEPLLEHGLSLGLAYVDAVSLMRTLPKAGQGAQ